MPASRAQGADSSSAACRGKERATRFRLTGGGPPLLGRGRSIADRLRNEVMIFRPLPCLAGAGIDHLPPRTRVEVSGLEDSAQYLERRLGTVRVD